MKNKVSVIVPVYNVQEYLEECLDSLAGQTLKDIDIICVNDGSTDGSDETLKKYAKKDKRIKVINKKNGGLSSARNAGLRECKTDYVMFCDSDDSYDKTICEKMLKAIERDQSDIAICGIKVIYTAHEEMKRSDDKYYSLKYSGEKRINDEVILNTDVAMMNKMFRMKIIKQYNISFPDGLNNEDFYFYNAYMSVASIASFVEDKLYNYKRREGSIMSVNFEKGSLSLDHLKIAERLFEFYRKEGFLRKHIDLFWKQWRLSYWFSYEHTSPDMRKVVVAEGKEFVKNNLDKYPPEDEELKVNIKDTFKNKFLRAVERAPGRIGRGIYRRTNIGYRQQLYINQNIERLQKKYDNLAERLDNLIKE